MNTKSLDIKKLLLDNGIIIVLLLLVLFTGIMKDNFFSANNLKNVLVNVAPRVIIAFGVSACLITKGTDLSAGRLVGLSACIAGTLLQNKDYANKMFPNLGDMNIFLVLLISVAICAVFGFINGVVVAHLNVPAFIGTLGMQLIVYGVCLVYTKAEPIGGYRTAYTTVATGNFLKIPYLFIYALIIYAVAGFLLGAKSGGSSVNMGASYELEAIAACTIGGVSVNGGIGRISGCVIGVLVFELLKSSMQFLGIKPDFQFIVQGIIIVVAIALDIRKYIQKK